MVEPALLKGWLTARSVARGLPLPVPDHGGLRVDTGLPNEDRRYVFARPEQGLQELARSIETPNVLIKLCGAPEQLLGLVPPRWQLQSAAFLMTQEGSPDAPQTLPAGYRLDVSIEQKATMARILARDGSLAASGYAVEYGGVFLFDRIVTETAHRRLGLGRTVMAALGATQQSSAAQRVLVATDDGRALYSTLGWVVRSPYTTVAIPSTRP